jgi:hypothetical protein
MDASFVDNEGQGSVASSADALDYCNPFPIAWLCKSRPRTSLRACNNFHRANYAHLEACLVKVVDVVVVDAVLSYCVLYEHEPLCN